jgi:hypothetical protein
MMLGLRGIIQDGKRGKSIGNGQSGWSKEEIKPGQLRDSKRALREMLPRPTQGDSIFSVYVVKIEFDLYCFP